MSLLHLRQDDDPTQRDARRIIERQVGRLTHLVDDLLDVSRISTGRVSFAREGAEAVLRVRDNGMGISPHMLPRVFELFTQAERSLDRAEGGLGVGLTVVQRVIEIHGGRVEAHSAGLGKGSEFIVRFPIVTRPGGESSSTPAKEGVEEDARALRVLVVDDNRDAADTAAMLLRHAGHEVRVEYSGSVVLDAALTFQAEIVLLDLGLPGKDGYEVAKALRGIRG